MLGRLWIYALLLLGAYLLFKRAWVSLLKLVEKKTAVKIEVDGLGLGAVYGIHVQIPKGTVARIWVEQISVGRSSSRRVHEGSGEGEPSRWRLPVTVRGLRLELRRKSPSNAYGHSGRRKSAGGLPQPLASIAVRGLLGLLPLFPLRLEGLTLFHQGIGLVLETAGVEFELRSLQLFRAVEARLGLAPLALRLEAPETGLEGYPAAPTAEGRSEPAPASGPILSIQETRIAAEMQWASEGFGVRFEILECAIGAVAGSVSMPLLLALAGLPHSPVRRKSPRRRKPPGAADLLSLWALLPEKVSLGVPAVRLEARDLGHRDRTTGASFELREVRFSAGRPPLTEVGGSSVKYQASISTEALKVRAGNGTEGGEAVASTCPRLRLDCCLRSESPGGSDAPGGRECFSVSGSVGALTTRLFPDRIWTAAAAAQSACTALLERRAHGRQSQEELSDGGSDVDTAPTKTAPGVELGEEFKSELRRRRKSPHERREAVDGLEDTAHVERLADQTSQEEASTSGRAADGRPMLWDLSALLSPDSSLVILETGGSVLARATYGRAIVCGKGSRHRLAGAWKNALDVRLELGTGAILLGDQEQPQSAWQILSGQEVVVGVRKTLPEPSVSGGTLGYVKLLGVAATLREERLDTLAAIARALSPPPGLLKTAWRPRKSVGSRLGTKPSRVGLSHLSLQLQQVSLDYATSVQIPAEFRDSLAGNELQLWTQQLAVGEVAVELDRQKGGCSARVSRVSVAFSEGIAPAGEPTLALENLEAQLTAAAQPVFDDTANRTAFNSRPAAQVNLSGLKGFFEADPAFAVLKSAADFGGLAASLAESAQKGDLQGDLGSSIPEASSIPEPTTNPVEGDPGKVGKGLDSPDVIFSLRSVDLRLKLSEEVCWGVRLSETQGALQTRNGFFVDLSLLLNDAVLARIGGAVVALGSRSRPGAWPEVALPPLPDTGGSAPAAAFEASGIVEATPTSPKGGFREAAGLSPRSWQRSSGRRSAGLSQESLPSVTEGSELDFPFPAAAGNWAGRPFGGEGGGLDAAYSRAGLGGWVSGSGEPYSGGRWQPPLPALIVECCLHDVLVTLPFGQDPGTAQRFSELWAKAFQQALVDSLAPLKKQRSSKSPAAREAGARREAPLELRLAVRSAMFKMDHHPMEAWLAVKGPLLRSVATHDSLWTKALGAVASSPPPLHASPSVRGGASFAGSPSLGRPEPDRRKADLERRQAVAAEAARSYVAKSAAASTRQVGGTGEGALMHAKADSADVVVVIGGSGPRSKEAALDHIAALDAASEGVPMRQVLKLNLDVAVGSTAVGFSGGSQPLAALAGLSASGAVMLARQVTGVPDQQLRPFRVGGSRVVDIPVSVKGSRALIKVFTDMRAHAEDPRVCFSIGLEPTIALVGQAGKRLSPTDPDKSRPKPPTLPWFDMLRYVWRGSLELTARHFEFSLGATADPNLHSGSERLQANVGALGLSWRPAKVELALDAVSASGYLSPSVDEAADAIRSLPLLDFPVLDLRIGDRWILPGGRSCQEHHLFPVPPLSGVQKAIDVVGIFQSSGLDLSIDAACSRDSDSSARKLLEELHGPRDLTLSDQPGIAYVGGHQIAFLRLLIERLQCPPLWSKMVNRRGTFFQRMNPKRPPILGIPKLLKRLDIRFVAPKLDVIHFTVDLEDPGCGIILSSSDVELSASLSLNVPAPRPILSGYSEYSKKREGLRVATALLELVVEASRVQLQWSDTSGWDKRPFRQSQDVVTRLQDRGSVNSSRASLDAAEALRTLVRSGSSASDAFIFAVGRLRVEGGGPDPVIGSPGARVEPRPMHVGVKDCRIHVDAGSRNAVWAAVAHILGALQLPRKFSPFSPSLVQNDGDASNPSTPGGGLQKRLSRDHIDLGKDLAGGPPDLLSLLLQQRDEPNISDAEETLMIDPGTDADDSDAEEDAAVAPEDAERQAAEDDEVREQLRGANEESKMKAWRDQEKEWAHAERKWEVDLEGLQICLEASEHSCGRFMLVAQRANLAGRRLTAAGIDGIHLYIDKTQALISQSSIDPGASATWLEFQDGSLQSGKIPSSLREVFTPFTLQLQNTKSMPQTNLEGRDAATTRRMAGEETRLLVPFVNVNMDSKEFAILLDVVNNVGLAQPPEVKRVNQDVQLLGEGESLEVNAMRETYASLRSYVHNLMAETLALRSSIGMRLRRDSSLGRNVYHPLAHSGHSAAKMSQTEMLQAVNLADALEDVPHISQALCDYLSRLSDPDSPQAGLALGPAVGQQLVLRWGQEQLEGAGQALESTAKLLRDLKKAAQKHRQARHANRFLLEVDGVSYSLCQEHKPFLEIAVTMVTLDSIRHRDRSGSSKLVVQHMEIVDMTGSISATQSTPEGAVLIPWNPDDSWKRDALLRVNAVLGPPTRSHTVYEHVDVMVHPLGVHLVESVATRFWDYFFPKEEAAVERQKRWVKSVEPKARHSRKGSHASNAGLSSDSEAGPAPPASVFATGGPLEAGIVAVATSATSTHTSPGISAPVEAPTVHRRGQSLDSGITGAAPTRPVMALTESPAALDPAVLQSAWLDHLLRQSPVVSPTPVPSSGAGHSHRKSASVDDSSIVAAGLSLESQEKPEKKARPKKKGGCQVQPPLWKVLFVHVRINRFHCRATYQGYPISFSDFKMVLDNRVYRSLDGRWRDLFQRIKWDTIKSVLKSVAGLQGRKFKELLQSFDRSERVKPEKKARAVAVKFWISNLGKKNRSAESEEGSGQIDPEALREKAKSKMLLGSQHLSRSTAHSSSLPTVYSGISDSLSGQLSELQIPPGPLSPGERSFSGGLPSPSKPPSGSKSARQASGLLLEKPSSASDQRPRSAGDAAFEWGRDVSSDSLVSEFSRDAAASKNAEKEQSRNSSRELPNEAGLSIEALMLGREAAEGADEEPKEDEFSWGKEVLEPKPTAKTKAAKLFGKAGSMLKEAGNSVSSATSAVAQHAQAAAAKARAAQAEKRGGSFMPGGEVIAKSKFGSLLTRQKKSNSPDVSAAGSDRRLSSEAHADFPSMSRKSSSAASETAPGLQRPSPQRQTSDSIPSRSGSLDVQRPPGEIKRILMPSAAKDSLHEQLAAQGERKAAMQPVVEVPLIDLEGSWEPSSAAATPSAFVQPGFPIPTTLTAPSQPGVPSETKSTAALASPPHSGNPFASPSSDPSTAAQSSGAGNPFGAAASKEKPDNAAGDNFMDQLLDF